MADVTGKKKSDDVNLTRKVQDLLSTQTNLLKQFLYQFVLILNLIATTFLSTLLIL